MRLKSSFKDYYDGVAKNGQDASLLYVRDQLIYDVPLVDYVVTENTTRLNKVLDNWWVIGFCGQVWLYHNRHQVGSDNYFLISHDRDTSVEYYKKPKGELKSKYGFWPDWGCIRINEKYDKFEADKSRFAEYFHTFDCPAFMIFSQNKPKGTSELLTNPCLSAIAGFIQRMPPFQAYQELQMWLANKASPEKEIPAISDEIMLQAKGFDKRYSFRKDKQK